MWSDFLLIVELLQVNGQKTQALRLVDSGAALYGSGMVPRHDMREAPIVS